MMLLMMGVVYLFDVLGCCLFFLAGSFCERGDLRVFFESNLRCARPPSSAKITTFAQSSFYYAHTLFVSTIR